MIKFIFIVQSLWNAGKLKYENLMHKSHPVEKKIIERKERTS